MSSVESKYKIMSIHWGLIPGGVAKYAQSVDLVGEYEDLNTCSVLIHNPKWDLDKGGYAAIVPEKILINARYDISWVLKLRKLIKVYQPDCLFVFGFNGAFAAWLASIGTHIPILASWHGDYFASSFAQKLRAPFIGLVEKLMYRHVVRHVVAVSEYSAKRLIKKGILQKKISVIHNGIPVNQDICRRKNDHPDVFVGTGCRLSEQKGLFWLLDAVALIREQNPKIRFVIWGDGPQKKILEQKAKTLGITDVLTFTGYVDDIGQRLLTLDIFMMSSYAEYFSIALLEAMRAGLPIVATDVGGNPEAVKSGVDGLLVPVEDHEAFCAAILELAGSVSKRCQFGQSARQRFERLFSDKIMIKRTAEWFMDKLNLIQN